MLTPGKHPGPASGAHQRSGEAPTGPNPRPGPRRARYSGLYISRIFGNNRCTSPTLREGRFCTLSYMAHLNLNLPDEMLAAVDVARSRQTRTRWIIEAITEHLSPGGHSRPVTMPVQEAYPVRSMTTMPATVTVEPEPTPPDPPGPQVPPPPPKPIQTLSEGDPDCHHWRKRRDPITGVRTCIECGKVFV